MQVNNSTGSINNYGTSLDLINIVGANYGTLGGLLNGANASQNGNFLNLLSGILGENKTADGSNALQNILNTLDANLQGGLQTNIIQNNGNELLPNSNLSSILNEVSKNIDASFLADNKFNILNQNTTSSVNKDDILKLLASVQNKFDGINSSIQISRLKESTVPPKEFPIPAIAGPEVIKPSENLVSAVDEFFNFLKKLLQDNNLGISDETSKEKKEAVNTELDSINNNINTQVNVFVQFIQAFENEVKPQVNVFVQFIQAFENEVKPLGTQVKKSLENISNNLAKASQLLQEKLPTLSSKDLNDIYQKLEKINDNLGLIQENITNTQKTITTIENSTLKAPEKAEDKTQNKTEKPIEGSVNIAGKATEKLANQSENYNSNNSAENKNSNQQNQLPEESDEKNIEVKFKVEDKEIAGTDNSRLVSNTENLRNTPSVSHTKTETSINSVSNQVLVKIENYFENGVKSGEQKFEIELFPKDLGRVTVEIDINKNGGENKIHITAENKSAFEALKNDRASIEKIFENNNLKLDNTNLSFDLRNNNQFAEQQARRQYFETLQNDFFANSSNSVSANLINDAVIASRSYSASLSLIDIMV